MMMIAWSVKCNDRFAVLFRYIWQAKRMLYLLVFTYSWFSLQCNSNYCFLSTDGEVSVRTVSWGRMVNESVHVAHAQSGTASWPSVLTLCGPLEMGPCKTCVPKFVTHDPNSGSPGCLPSFPLNFTSAVTVKLALHSSTIMLLALFWQCIAY